MVKIPTLWPHNTTSIYTSVYFMAGAGNPCGDYVQWCNQRSTEYNLLWELAFLLMVTIAQTRWCLGSKVTISLPPSPDLSCMD